MGAQGAQSAGHGVEGETGNRGQTTNKGLVIIIKVWGNWKNKGEKNSVLRKGQNGKKETEQTQSKKRWKQFTISAAHSQALSHLKGLPTLIGGGAD